MQKSYKLLIVLLICFSSAKAQIKDVGSDQISISGKITGFERTGDSVYLNIWNKIPLKDRRSFTKHMRVSSGIGDDGSFHFQLKRCPNEVYISIGKDYIGGSLVEMLSLYLAQPGDQITMAIKPRTDMQVRKKLGDNGKRVPISGFLFDFEGIGTDKFKCRQMIELDYELRSKQRQVLGRTLVTNADNFMNESSRFISQLDSAFIAASDIIKRFGPRLSDKVGKLMEVDVRCRLLNEKYKFLSMNIANFSKLTLSQQEQLFSKKTFLYGNMESDSYIGLLDKSAYFSEMVLARFAIQEKIDAASKAHALIRKEYNGELAEKLLIADFMIRSDRGENLDNELDQLISSLKNQIYKAELLDIRNNRRAGKEIMNFKLLDENGKVFKLSDLGARVIFIDFWFTGCSGCIEYYNSVLKEVERELGGEKGLAFVSVSIDADFAKWKQSLASGKYTSSGAINLNTGKEGGRHQIITALKIASYPRPMIIDQQGNILNDNFDDLRSKKVLQVLKDALKK